MGSIADEIILGFEGSLYTIEHIIKSFRQLGNFISPFLFFDTQSQVKSADMPRLRDNFPYGLKCFTRKKYACGIYYYYGKYKGYGKRISQMAHGFYAIFVYCRLKNNVIAVITLVK